MAGTRLQRQQVVVAAVQDGHGAATQAAGSGVVALEAAASSGQAAKQAGEQAGERQLQRQWQQEVVVVLMVAGRVEPVVGVSLSQQQELPLVCATSASSRVTGLETAPTASCTGERTC